MSVYKLFFFNARGSAEVSRLALAAVGMQWEDFRFPNKEEWLNLKGAFEAGTLPCLKVDDFQISQSQAILRFIGREHDLYGEGNIQNTQVDIILDDVRDFIMEILKWVFEENEAKKEELKKTIMEVKRPALVDRFEKLLQQNTDNSGYFVGSKLTIADIAVFDLFDSFGMIPGFSDIIMDSEILKKHADLVKSNSGIADWLKKRPVTER